MATWTEGTFLLVGSAPVGFKGIRPAIDSNFVRLQEVSATGLVVVHLTWQDLGIVDFDQRHPSDELNIASPFHGAASGNDDRSPIALVDVSRTARDARLHFRFFAASRVRLSGFLFSLAWEGELSDTSTTEELFAAFGTSGETLHRMSEESAQASTLLPDVEMEIKYTLVTEISPWRVASVMSRALQSGTLQDFCSDMGNEIQRWTYDQFTYAIYRDGESAGYVAFMRARSGQYHVKYKLFEHDQLRRRETFDTNVDLDPSEFELYLGSRMQEYTFSALPALVRSRFDVNVLSQRTGHFYGLETDEIHAGEDTMRQLEIEYHRTQHVLDSGEETIESELERLSALVEGVLESHGIEYTKGFKSKLTWLREVQDLQNG